MKLLTAAAAGLAVGALYVVFHAELSLQRRSRRHFHCWLCKRPTAYVPRGGVEHHDCGYCGIGNKVPPGAAVGQLPDIQAVL